MFRAQGRDAGVDAQGLSGRLLEILAEAEVPPFPLHERFGRGGFSCDVDGPAFPVEVRARHRLRAAPPFVEEVLRILDPDRRAFMPRGLGEGGHLELEEEQSLLPDEVEPRIEHLEGGSTTISGSGKVRAGGPSNTMTVPGRQERLLSRTPRKLAYFRMRSSQR